jgi:tRNA (cmo5U34)-methyltransferase
MKSTVDEIRQRFDNDVERFSNLETGQSATIDAPVALSLISQAAVATTPNAKRLLDVGCGAGNFTLRLLQCRSMDEITLVDLSRPMLERAEQRIRTVHQGKIITIQADIREISFADEGFDIVLSAAVLHHLRTESEWQSVFEKLHRTLAPGGSWWIFDMVTHPNPAVHELMWARYGQYLCSTGDAAYRDRVFAYIEKEDTPRPLMDQLLLLRQVGFSQVDVLHYNTCFAAFGGVK